MSLKANNIPNGNLQDSDNRLIGIMPTGKGKREHKRIKDLNTFGDILHARMYTILRWNHNYGTQNKVAVKMLKDKELPGKKKFCS